MRRTLPLRAVVLVLLVSAVPAHPAQGKRRAVAVSGRTFVDCTAANPKCPEIRIAGDAPATLPNGAASPSRGFADPTIRRDSATGIIWMAYSWPHTVVDSGPGPVATTTVDSHLARSFDNGSTWSFVRPLWTTRPESDESGASGYVNNETVTLAQGDTASTAGWYSARFRYFTKQGSAPKITSFTLRVAHAGSPAELASADEAILGGSLTSSYWHADVNLAALSPELSGCTWNDPAILVQNGTIYLATECQMFTPDGEDATKEFVALFATQPTGNVHGWSWKYLGKLSNRSDAIELGGENLLQTDLVHGRDGALLAIFSPSSPSSPLAIHYGCRVVEMASLDQARLARDAAGHLKVRAIVTASDEDPYGPAACAYEPASATGVVIVRRQIRPELVVTLNASGLRP